MGGSSAATAIREARWPVVTSMAAVTLLLAVLPGRLRPFPSWVLLASSVLVIAPVIGAGLGRRKPLWERIEHSVILLFCALMLVAMVANLAVLLRLMLSGSQGGGGLQLLSSSVALWATCVLIFALAAWQTDRGGPGPRAAGAGVGPDWFFPEETVPESAARGWRPTFVAYLFMAYSVATSFTAAHGIPLTARAKLLTMAAASISLLTIVMVVSRAINVLNV